MVLAFFSAKRRAPSQTNETAEDYRVVQDVKIIKADHCHVPDVLKVLDACKREMQQTGIHQWDDVYPSRRQIEEDAEAGDLYVAVSSERIAGAVSFNGQQEEAYQLVQWRGALPVLVVHRLCVDPELQGKGIACKLMQFGHDLCAQLHYKGIRLDAYSGNPRAIALYESLGYRKVGSIMFPRRDLPFHCYEKVF